MRRPSNGFLNGEKDMACDMTMWSSSICDVSSAAFMMYVPVSLYGTISRLMGFHSPSILSSAVSIAYSLAAVSPTLVIMSM